MSLHRDTIVIGASSGGARALRELLGHLPSKLDASIFVVLHRPSEASAHLSQVLGAESMLPMVTVDRELEPRLGHIYFAAPNLHVVLAHGKVFATRTAPENRARPSIDVLFRTAASDRGSRVIAVLLTGMLEDGVAGLVSVRRCGGLVVVPESEAAALAQMTRRTVESVEIDHLLPLDAIANRLANLVDEEVLPNEIPEDVRIAARMAGP